jgi:Flp pilus assembly CpaF family ATPase
MTQEHHTIICGPTGEPRTTTVDELLHVWASGHPAGVVSISTASLQQVMHRFEVQDLPEIPQ